MKQEEDVEERERELIRDLKEYQDERARLKQMLGQIGGKAQSRVDALINLGFLVIIITLFVLEITTHIVPTFISLEIGVLLVSIKIVWMIHINQKHQHFQFWVLNTIEFRLNDLTKKVNSIDRRTP